MVPTGNITQKYEAVPTSSTDIPPFVEAEVSKIFRIVVFSLVTIASLLGNIVVCNAVDNQGHRKTLPYLLVANLAVAEIISTLCLPFVFVYVYIDNWPFGKVGCTLIIPLQVASMFVVTSTLAVIAVYRYYFIAHQLALRKFSSCKVKGILILLWVVPFVFCLPIFMYHKIFVNEDGKVSCYSIFPGDDFAIWPHKLGIMSKYYNIARFIFNFIVPCLVMVLAYVAVASKLKRFARKMSIGRSLAGSARNKSQPDEVNLQHEEDTTLKIEQDESPARNVAKLLQDPSLEAQGHVVGRQIQNRRRGWAKEHDLVRMFYMLIIIFLVFYVPYQVFYMYNHFGGTWPSDYLYLYLDLLSNFSSALHPLCYGTVNYFYARSFRRLVLCK